MRISDIIRSQLGYATFGNGEAVFVGKSIQQNPEGCQNDCGFGGCRESTKAYRKAIGFRNLYRDDWAEREYIINNY